MTTATESTDQAEVTSQAETPGSAAPRGFVVPDGSHLRYGPAGPCPTGKPSCEHRRQTRVVKTVSGALHCICDTCAHEWKRTAVYSPLTAYTEKLVEALEQAQHAEFEAGRGLFIPAASVRELVDGLRSAIEAAAKLKAPRPAAGADYGGFGSSFGGSPLR